MRILSVNKFYHLYGGTERYMFALNQLCEEHGHELVHFSMEDEKNLASPFSEYFVNKQDFFNTSSTLSKIKGAVNVIYSVEAERKLDKLLRITVPDIAHLHNIAHQLSPSILYALKRYQIPVIQTLHDYKLVCPTYTLFTKGKTCERCLTGNYFHATLNRCNKDSILASMTNSIEMYLHRFLQTYEHVDLFISPSRFLREKMIQGGVDASKIHHVPLFIQASDFEPKYSHEGYLLFLGQLIEVKGIGTLLRALNHTDTVRVVVAGRGQQEEQYRSLASELGLNVDFVGFQSGNALKQLVRGAMAVVVPSLWYENQPFAILESFAYGKPVIGTKIGGIPELIDEYQNGLLFEAGNIEELSKKIQWLVQNQDQLADMGRSARRKIEEQFSPDVHYKEIERVYNSLV